VLAFLSVLKFNNERGFMRLRTKKWVVCLLATMLMIPASLYTGILTAKPAMAAAPEKIIGVSGVTAFPSAEWHTYTNAYGKELYTDGSVVGAYVEADDALDNSVDLPGIYKIEAEWRVWNNHTHQATYEISQGAGATEIIPSIDQTKKADKTSTDNGKLSGYYSLNDDYHFYGKSDVNIKLLGKNSDDGNNSFVNFKVTFVSEDTAPTAPVMTSPADSSYVKSQNPEFVWQPSTDSDNDAITYELFVYKVGDSAAKIHKTGLTSTSFQSTNPHKLSDGQYYWYVIASDGEKDSKMAGISSFTVDTVVPTAITDLAGNVVKNEVDLAWSDSTDANGIAGYNVYRILSTEVPSPTDVSLNLALITDAKYTDMPGNGDFIYYVKAFDNAGNESAISNVINAHVDYLPTPVVAATPGDGKSINVSFNGVGGGVTSYEIYVNGIISKTISVAADDKGNAYKENVSVASYGDYSVKVVAKSATETSSSEVVSVKLTAPVPVVGPSVTTSNATAVSFTAPATAQAATAAPSGEEQSDLDQNGQIKAAEDTSNDSEDNKINWTPWIILFILILLAGAATGGYFYWFGGDSEGTAATAVVKEKKIVAAPVKKDSAKKVAPKNNKKSRRW